jgi:hypothetical protein
MIDLFRFFADDADADVVFASLDYKFSLPPTAWGEEESFL